MKEHSKILFCKGPNLPIVGPVPRNHVLPAGLGQGCPTNLSAQNARHPLKHDCNNLIYC